MKNSTKYFDLRAGNHFSFEVDAWLREIDFLIVEVSNMKTLLAVVVELISDQPSLDLAEMYQNKLLDLELCLNSIKEKIKKHLETIKLNLVTLHPANDKKNSVNHNKLRKEVHNVERNYITTKNEFNRYVSEIYRRTIN